MTLNGSTETGVCKMISGKKLQKIFKNKWAQVAQLFLIHGVEQMGDDKEQEGDLRLSINSQPPPQWKLCELDSLDKLLVEFDNLFMEPNFLPPSRPLDHSITLKPNTEPANIRAYRYSPKQKPEY